MNFQNSQKLFENRVFRYSLRILTLYTFSVIFKSFDLTFVSELRADGLRSFMFSLLYVLFGFLVWEGAVRLSRFIERRSASRDLSLRMGLLCAGLLGYGLLVALFFGFFYGITDVLLFNRYEAWQSFRSLSYDMHFGTFLFYMLILAFNGIIFYYSRWHEYQVKTERLMRENIQARYGVLMNQVEPHFFFNSLSVLSNLVYKDPDLSAEYITRLAKCYRYILDKKFENLISVEAELEFLESYIFLMQVRHQDHIVFDIDITETVKQQGLIPPATLQMLVENAIKHNRFSSLQPLHIRIHDGDGLLQVSNTLCRRNLMKPSTGIGLANIRKRYELSSGTQIGIQETEDRFIVKLPIL